MKLAENWGSQGASVGVAEEDTERNPTWGSRGRPLCVPPSLGATKDSDGAAVTKVLAASQERQIGTQSRVIKGSGVRTEACLRRKEV